MADLEELAGPRLVVGLGAAWSAIAAHGLENPRPVRALAEAGDIVRGLLAGGPVSYRGEVFRLPEPGVALGFAPVRGACRSTSAPWGRGP